MKELVIIKCNVILRGREFHELWEGLVKMARKGVILLPPGCELVNEVPPNPEIVVIGEEKPGGL